MHARANEGRYQAIMHLSTGFIIRSPQHLTCIITISSKSYDQYDELIWWFNSLGLEEQIYMDNGTGE